MFYDIKFGRKKESTAKDAVANGHTNGNAECNGNSSNGTSNGSGLPKNTSDMAIYEQYRNQVLHISVMG